MSYGTKPPLAYAPSEAFGAREYLKSLFRDYWNNYLTVDRFAEVHNVDNVTMLALIDEGRRYHNQDAEQGKVS